MSTDAALRLPCFSATFLSIASKYACSSFLQAHTVIVTQLQELEQQQDRRNLTRHRNMSHSDHRQARRAGEDEAAGAELKLGGERTKNAKLC
jgi:hypothetical protein